MKMKVTVLCIIIALLICLGILLILQSIRPTEYTPFEVMSLDGPIKFESRQGDKIEYMMVSVYPPLNDFFLTLPIQESSVQSDHADSNWLYRITFYVNTITGEAVEMTVGTERIIIDGTSYELTKGWTHEKLLEQIENKYAHCATMFEVQ